MNEEQIAYWNGPAARRWSEQQEALDAALAAFGSAALDAAAVRGGEHVLDVGCGCGATALALSDRVGQAGSVLGVDVSAHMLARARERAGARANLRFVEVDAGALPAGPQFDLLFSRFGVMFFDDPRATFHHLRAAMRLGGRLAFVCWRALEQNPWILLPLAALQRVIPDLALPGSAPGPGPFSFADSSQLEQLLTDAGWSEITIERFDADVILSATDLDEAVQFSATAGPAARVLGGSDPALRARAEAELRRTLAPLHAPDGFALAGSSWLVRARVTG
jgi:SAM-dependent methyltransferase